VSLMAMDKLGGVIREPLVHFLGAGLMLFALDGSLADGSHASADARVIVVDAAVRARLADDWQRIHGAPPSPSRHDELVAGWIDEQVLYREGLARGLERDDPRIIDRVASKMAFVL
jgi:peptidyl-prolyl cis-trans isomerase C